MTSKGGRCLSGVLLKHQQDGAREGAEFIREHIIRVTDKAFDDFAAAGTTPLQTADTGLGLEHTDARDTE